MPERRDLIWWPSKTPDPVCALVSAAAQPEATSVRVLLLTYILHYLQLKSPVQPITALLKVVRKSPVGVIASS
jgi:hypothetical protein